jgi:hypothetical protein
LASFMEHSASFREHLASLREHSASCSEHSSSFGDYLASFMEHLASFREPLASFREPLASFGGNINDIVQGTCCRSARRRCFSAKCGNSRYIKVFWVLVKTHPLMKLGALNWSLPAHEAWRSGMRPC